ncbi:MAG: hypothetical protein JOZ32_12035, partial [Bryobacterales bacterium]|nr:hypothetical protein [Bryobacterales bacterium]
SDCGGLFGYYGLFTTAKLGKSTWYVTKRENGVVVIAGAKTCCSAQMIVTNSWPPSELLRRRSRQNLRLFLMLHAVTRALEGSEQ